MTDKNTQHTIREVKDFWERNPLLQGELHQDVGSREWFEAADRLHLDEIYMQDLSEFFIADVDPGTLVLEVGCGPGFWVRRFAAAGVRRVLACDLTENAARLAGSSLPGEARGSVLFCTANAEKLPYASNSFDHINCQGVIHHTPDTEQCIREFGRVLKPGGTACFSVYHNNFVFRHPALFRTLLGVARKLFRLRGRGRESMLDVDDPGEMVRMYDGQDNPIGKAYTKGDVEAMCRGVLDIRQSMLFYFPSRALSLPLPKWFRRWLNRNLGLMIAFRAVKP